MEKLYKTIFTDYYFPDINKEINQLKKLGKVKIIDCSDLITGKVSSEDQLLEHLQKYKAMDANAVLVSCPINNLTFEYLFCIICE